MTNIDRNSELHNDYSCLYEEVEQEFTDYKTVTHGWKNGGFYVDKDGQTTNNVENFFGAFKRGMRGVNHFRGEQHPGRFVAQVNSVQLPFCLKRERWRTCGTCYCWRRGHRLTYRQAD